MEADTPRFGSYTFGGGCFFKLYIHYDRHLKHDIGAPGLSCLRALIVLSIKVRVLSGRKTGERRLTCKVAS